MGQNVKKIYIFGYLGGSGKTFNDQTGQIRKQFDNNFLSLNPEYELFFFFTYLGRHGWPKFQGSQTSS